MSKSYAQGLRKLAAFLEAHPEYNPWLRHTLDVAGLNLHLREDYEEVQDKPAALERFYADLTEFGGSVVAEDLSDPGTEDNLVDIRAHLDGIKLSPLVWRHDLCERVEVGVEEVTESVPDPDADVPYVEVTREVPVYQWVCAEDAL